MQLCTEESKYCERMCNFLFFTQTEASSWTIAVPSSVKGLLGSCVVIPCSYNYPNAKVQTFTGIWTNDGNQVIYHPTESKMLEQYRRRTKLLGDVSKSNCSLMIENLQQNDGGPFHFRIELGGYNSFSYLNKKVSISMIREPNAIDFSAHEDIKEGQPVSASCSVFHSCPTYPPAFHWSHSGEQHFQAQKLHDGQWKATSILMFRSNRTDHNKLLQCRVTYHGGKHQETSKTLKVKCKCAFLNINVIMHGLICAFTTQKKFKHGQTNFPKNLQR
uniref:Ig-like domain-containing protein n=1 Tax=Pundamilia nyererei TaxID=303518 RepID=A0A3B4FME7_9CICH